MNLTNVTINVSPKAKKELTPEQQQQNAFMKMSPAKKWEFIYDMLMDHEERISTLEPEVEPEPTPDTESIETGETYNFTSYGDSNRTTQYATGTVTTTGITRTLDEDEYTEVEVTTNTVEEFIGKKYYVISNANISLPPANKYYVYRLYEYNEDNDILEPVDIWVSITH